MHIGPGTVAQGAGLGFYSTGAAAGTDEETDETETTSPGANTGPTDPAKCDPNILYPSGSVCNAVQTGVDIGTAMKIKQYQTQAQGGTGIGTGTPQAQGQWIKGISNTMVLAAGGLLLFAFMRNR